MLFDDSPGLWIERSAQRYPHRIALITERATLSYAALYERIGSLAAYYRERGLHTGQSLALVSQHAESLVTAVHLCLYCGVTLLPLDPRREGMLSSLKELGFSRVLVDTATACGLSRSVRKLPILRMNDVADTQWIPPTPLSDDHVQLVVATSGTGGALKAVMLSPLNLSASVLASRERLGLEAGDVWLACLPIYHIGGLALVLRCLQAGATLLLHDRFDPRELWQDLEVHAVTHVSLVPTMLARLLDHCADSPPPSRLRVVLVGGGALSSTLAVRAVRAGWPIYPSYGMTETASQMATLCRITEEWRSGDVGQPLTGMQVDIVDEEGRPTRGEGRIRVSGAGIMMGYANPNAVRGVGLDNGAFTSNDLGCIDRRGHLHILGRADEMLVCGGENVFPQEVEARLQGCPGVEDVAVGGRHDVAWGHCLVALVVGTVAETQLRDWCETHLPGFMRPRSFIKVERLPRNRLGKLDRGRLGQWLLDSESVATF